MNDKLRIEKISALRFPCLGSRGGMISRGGFDLISGDTKVWLIADCPRKWSDTHERMLREAHQVVSSALAPPSFGADVTEWFELQHSNDDGANWHTSNFTTESIESARAMKVSQEKEQPAFKWRIAGRRLTEEVVE